MVICEIGNNFSSTTSVNYLSDRSFIDFDLIIIDFNILLHGFERTGSYDMETKNIFIKRKADLEEYQKHTRIPIVVFAPTFKSISFSSVDFYLDFFLPIPKFAVQNERGQKINILPGTLFNSFLKKFESFFSYNSFFINYEGTVIAETPLTKKVLSFYNTQSIFLPQLKAKFDAEVEKDFLNNLLQLANEINKEKKDVDLPEWTKKYYLPFEIKTSSELLKLNEEIKEREKIIDLKEVFLKEIIDKKILFCGTGKELENGVEKIFKELDCEISPTEEGRDDLIIKYKDRVAVIEIKGIGGTAAEKHAAQLEKWRMNYYTENDVQPKAILLVNSFKDQELKERTNETWPHQMLKFSEAREHCLITTLQLLGIYLEVKKDPSCKEKLIESIFDTIGVYKEFHDWTKFIDQSE